MLGVCDGNNHRFFFRHRPLTLPGASNAANSLPSASAAILTPDCSPRTSIRSTRRNRSAWSFLNMPIGSMSRLWNDLMPRASTLPSQAGRSTWRESHSAADRLERSERQIARRHHQSTEPRPPKQRQEESVDVDPDWSQERSGRRCCRVVTPEMPLAGIGCRRCY